ncbi:MAG: hypothetical protein ACXAEN_17725 [Candidatus Thorarchaeota archaeon]|jgi:hypothetical protein
MTEEKKIPKDKPKIKTIQDGIFECERDLKEINDLRDYITSVLDQIRRELSVVEDGHAEDLEGDAIDIMADEDNSEDRQEKYNTFIAAALSTNLPLDQIIEVVDRPTQRKIAAQLVVLEARISRTKEVRAVKPVMKERGRTRFEAKYGKVDDGGKIIKG